MAKLHQIAVSIFGIFSLIAIASCSDNSIAIKPTTTSSTTPSIVAKPKSEPSVTPKGSNPETIVTQATGDLLSSEQKTELKQLATPIVVPTYLPAGFRLIKFYSGKEELRDGSYVYYSILYRGENDTCLDISLNTDPAMRTSRLERKEIQASVSNRVVVLSGDVEDKPITLGQFTVPNAKKNSGYMLRTGAWMPSNKEGANVRCNSVSAEEYNKVLQALEVLNLDENTNGTGSATPREINNTASSPSNLGNLLSLEQKAQLSQLGIEVILPTYLPMGTKLVEFKTYQKKTSQINDYSFYKIEYVGSDNTCIEAGSGYQSMWQENPSKIQIETNVGAVEVSSGTHRRSGTLQHWGWIRKNANGQSLITGGRSATGQPCNPINFEEYNKVLQSLEVLNK